MKKIIPIIKAETLIPNGPYCYTPVQAPCEENAYVFKIKSCPFWAHYSEEKHGELPDYLEEYKGKYAGAYCRYLKTADGFKDGTSLLWDQIKECGVKDEEYDTWEDLGE